MISVITFPRFIFITSIALLFYSGYFLTESMGRTSDLEALLSRGVTTEGTITQRALTHGSGPKPQPDFGYLFTFNDRSFTGTILGRGAFKLSPSAYSVQFLKEKPVIGEKLTVTYLSDNPQVNAPFLVTHREVKLSKMLGISATLIIFGLSMLLMVLSYVLKNRFTPQRM